MTAFELCALQDWEEEYCFRVGNSSVLWEAASYRSGVDKVHISRVCSEGGKPFLMGLSYKSRYIIPETKITLVRK